MIARVLKLYAAVEGTTIRVLAKKIGISTSTLSRILNGKPMDLHTYLKLNAWLFGDKNHPGRVQ